MKRWACLLLGVMLVAPAAADDKKKDEKKGAPTPAPPVVAQDALKEAEAKLAAGNADEAIKLLEKAMLTDGKAALRLGVLRESRGELDPAVDAYKAAASLLPGPGKGEALGRMAVVQDARGMGDAGATAEAAIAADPEGVWPTIAMSYHLAHQGKPDEAITLAQKAAAGGGAAATAALAHAQAAKGDMSAAEASYRQALAADPTALEPTIGLATVLRETGRAAEAEPLLAGEALADANLAAAMAENDPDAQALVVEVKVARALQEVAEGQPDLGVQDLTQLRDQNPSSSAVRLGLAKAQIARRDPAAAIAELQKAVELDPKNAEAQYQLGFVLLRMKGDSAAAVAPFEKAVALEPGSTLYATALGSALVGAQKFDAAIDLLTRLTAPPAYKLADGYVLLGQAYVQSKRYKDALPVLEKATSLAPESPDAWATLAWAYFGLKDAAKFKEAGGKARTLGYKEPTLLTYLKRIEGGEPIK
jgi:tetratricopeptide (TPR) repeat protein